MNEETTNPPESNTTPASDIPEIGAPSGEIGSQAADGPTGDAAEKPQAPSPVEEPKAPSPVEGTPGEAPDKPPGEGREPASGEAPPPAPADAPKADSPDTLEDIPEISESKAEGSEGEVVEDIPDLSAAEAGKPKKIQFRPPPPPKKKSKIGNIVAFVVFPIFFMGGLIWISKNPDKCRAFWQMIGIIGSGDEKPKKPRVSDPIRDIELIKQEAEALIRKAQENKNDEDILDQAFEKAEEAIRCAEESKKIYRGSPFEKGSVARLDSEIDKIRRGPMRQIKALRPTTFPKKRRETYLKEMAGDLPTLKQECAESLDFVRKMAENIKEHISDIEVGMSFLPPEPSKVPPTEAKLAHAREILKALQESLAALEKVPPPATTAESPKEPEAKEPEAKEPETPKEPEAKEPETPKEPEAKEPETPKEPEAKEPETPKEPEAKEPETPKEPEAKEPETPKEPEAKEPETPKEPEAKEPETPKEPEDIGPGPEP